jgi:hypothetical protein
MSRNLENTSLETPRLPFWNFKEGEGHPDFFKNFMVKASNFEEHLVTFVFRTALCHFSEATSLILEISKVVKLQMDSNNNFEQATIEINSIKGKMKELDI